VGPCFVRSSASARCSEFRKPRAWTAPSIEYVRMQVICAAMTWCSAIGRLQSRGRASCPETLRPASGTGRPTHPPFRAARLLGMPPTQFEQQQPHCRQHHTLQALVCSLRCRWTRSLALLLPGHAAWPSRHMPHSSLTRTAPPLDHRGCGQAGRPLLAAPPFCVGHCAQLAAPARQHIKAHFRGGQRVWLRAGAAARYSSSAGGSRRLRRRALVSSLGRPAAARQSL